MNLSAIKKRLVGLARIDPIVLADWAQRKFQKQGASFYGKLATAALCTFFLADLTAMVVGRFLPEPPPARQIRSKFSDTRARSLDDYSKIFARNLFSSNRAMPGDGTAGATQLVDLAGEPVKTALPLNLIGTLILRNELRSIATIEDTSARMVYPVRINDEIPAKARILKITSERVVFVNIGSGQREYIELPQNLSSVNPRISLGTAPRGPGIEKLSPTQYNISRTEVDKTLGDLNNVLTQARCVPNFENGMAAGYKCFQIVPGSIYDKLGMKNGDVVSAINGQPMSDPGKALEQLGALKESSHFELTVKRDGRTQTLVYDIR
ncbi:MAG: hypothetical protein A2583_00885 [Bdellovibrionales bacterium RIFOXYD1_FULL_53_11]|nr:MAG: hypothetical protein A2583_00885 [Bdellovibrionales bacterium RIFOXYD1_FULL_53_11]